jgi:RHS repeat-associated protein
MATGFPVGIGPARGRAIRRWAVTLVGLTMTISLLTVIPSTAPAHADTPSAVRPVIGRTATTVTYANPDGTKTTETHSGPINYLDSSGTWQPIDTHVVAAGPGLYKNAAGPLNLSFAAVTGLGDLVTITSPSPTSTWSLGFHLNSMTVGRSGSPSGSEISYSEVVSGVDLEYHSTTRGLKEDIVDKTATAASTAIYRFPLTLAGLTPRTNADGTISLLDASGNEAVRVPTGAVSDSANPPAVGTVVTSVVSTAPGLYELDVTPDATWMTDLGRVLPIHIDPGFNAGRDTAGGDSYGESDNPNGNYDGNAQTFDGGAHYVNKIGYLGTPQVEYVSFADFDISPASNKQILSATYNTFMYGWNGLSPNDFFAWRATSHQTPPNYGSNRRSHSGEYKQIQYYNYSTWSTADMTDWVTNWASGAWPNDGLVYDTAGYNTYFEMAADETGSSGTDSYISITWQEFNPIINSAALTSNPTPAGSSVTWNVYWSDPGFSDKAVICKTNSIAANGTCPGGSWASGALSGSPSSASYPTTQADAGRTYDYWAFECRSGGPCSGSRYGQFTVSNPPPSISNATASPQTATEGGSVTFAVFWSDPPGDTDRAVICKTNNANAGSCAAGQAWAIGGLSGTSPSYTGITTTHDEIGTHTFYAFACDSSNGCSSAFTGQFTVNPSSVPGATTAASDMAGLEDFYSYRPWDLGAGAQALVNTATGNLVVQHDDLAVGGQGLSLGITRTYNESRDAADSAIGYGWNIAVTDTPASGLGRGHSILATSNQLAFYDADGTLQNFVKDGAAGAGWHSPPGVNLTVSDATDGQGHMYYVVTRPDGVAYEIRLAGSLYHVTLVKDGKGNTLTFAYSLDLLQTVTDVKGRTLTFTWTNGYVSNVHFADGAQSLDTTYAVDSVSNRLTSVTEAAGTSSARTTYYAYSAPYGLRTVTDARGSGTIFTGGGGRLTSLTDRAGKTWTLTYGADTCGDGPPGTLTITCVTDQLGHVSSWVSTTAEANLVQYRDAGDSDAAGSNRTNIRNYVWSGNRLLRAIDEVGNIREYSWSALGSLTDVRITGQGEAPFETTLAYSSCATGIETLTDVHSAVNTTEERDTHFAYDTSCPGLLVRETDPIGTVTTYAYYVRGLLKSVTDGNSRVTTYGDSTQPDGAYHNTGQPTKVTDPTNLSESLVYDFLGHQTQRTDRLGKVWRQTYDLRGNLTQETDPLSHSTLHCYDGNDNEVLVVGPRSPAPACTLNGTDGYSTYKTYDSRDLLSSTLTASDGQRRKSVDTYDDAGQLTSILEPRSFDPATGNQLTDPNLLQRATYLRYPDGRTSAFIDEEGNQTDVVYTGDGKPSVVTDPASSVGRHSMTYTYTKLGDVKSELESGHANTTFYLYDLHGDQTVQSTPAGQTTVNSYDKDGRLVQTTNALLRISTRTYDAVGNLLSLVQPADLAGSTTVNYTYTPRNEIATESDPADPLHSIAYTYDAEGHQLLRRDLHNNVVERTVSQTWLDDGRLASRDAVGAPSAEHKSVFGYDAAGNQTAVSTYAAGSATVNVSSIAATYSSANELKTWSETIYPTATSGSGITKSSSYGYAQDGLLANRTIDGQATSYTQFRNGLEKTTTPWVTGTFSSTYTASGLLQHQSIPNGDTLDQTYDLANRVVNRDVKRGDGTTLSAWDGITYDEDDNRKSEVAVQAQIDGTSKTDSGTWFYDRLDRLITAKVPFDDFFVPYALDDAGNVLTELGATYTYHANRLLQKTAVPSTSPATTYNYDDFGNRTQDITGTDFTNTAYDAASHTDHVTFGDGSAIGYAYDGLDRQVRRSGSDSNGASVPTVLFFHDGLTDQIALETSDTGTATTRYVLDSTGQPIASDDPTKVSTAGVAYYVTDPRNNLTQLVSHNQAAVVATYGYDSFGQSKPAQTSAVAGWASRLQFQLSPKDSKTGTYAMGPRLFDPGTYRFIGADFVTGSAEGMDLQGDPLTGNRYLYAGTNPANLIDDGHRPKKPSHPARHASGASGGGVSQDALGVPLMHTITCRTWASPVEFSPNGTLVGGSGVVSCDFPPEGPKEIKVCIRARGASRTWRTLVCSDPYGAEDPFEASNVVFAETLEGKWGYQVEVFSQVHHAGKTRHRRKTGPISGFTGPPDDVGRRPLSGGY